ncbi:MAG TPA: hypothetical protein VHG51_03275 [Longimicrobiaceae bacterium]|nr:hypothetical protein [Longimicrobiaceae bacterium]
MKRDRAQDTWEIFFDTVQASFLCRVGAAPLPEVEDPEHPGVRAMQRGRRFAWMHARHVRGLSMFEAIRLAQRLAEAFAAWTRSAVAHDLAALREVLRAAEESARKPASMEAHVTFVEMFAALGADQRFASPVDAAFEAFSRARAARA